MRNLKSLLACNHVIDVGRFFAGALAGRFPRLVEQFVGDAAAAKAQGQQRALLKAVAEAEPATLNQVAANVKRGAPAVSRAIDALVRAGLVERRKIPTIGAASPCG